MFLHAGWIHLLGNMLFLWIFGDNVEDRLGHIPYLVFYLLAGIAAMALQTAFSIDSLTPTVGASGAIAGVMGAYLILHPGAMIQVIVLPLFFIPFFVPAFLLILFWFLMQVLGGLAELGQTTGSSIAWWAHIGGFIAGVVLIFLAGGRGRNQEPRPGFYPP
jgi:membrane associated rhomboid family serine protease